jgi:hypothetical protein
MVSHDVRYFFVEGCRSECLVKGCESLGKRVGVKNSLLSRAKTSIKGKFGRASKNVSTKLRRRMKVICILT